MATERAGETQVVGSNEIAFCILQENRLFDGEKIAAIINGSLVYKGFNLQDALLKCSEFKQRKRLPASVPEYIRIRTEDEISQDLLLPSWASFE